MSTEVLLSVMSEIAQDNVNERVMRHQLAKQLEEALKVIEQKEAEITELKVLLDERTTPEKEGN